jgi:CO dehydrogenase maturation factor
MVMGRPEGPGCYCAANNIIRKYTDLLSDKYPYVVIDNEAGMEHLSRRTTHKVDLLIIVSDPTIKGIMTAKRINELVDELRLDVEKRVLIINRVNKEGAEQLKKLAEDSGLKVAGIVPEDKSISEFDLKGIPIYKLPENSLSVSALFNILETLQIP